jgi:hypothetical protein
MEGIPTQFTSATETITNLANLEIKEGVIHQSNRLEIVAETDSNIISGLAQRHPRTDNRSW